MKHIRTPTVAGLIALTLTSCGENKETEALIEERTPQNPTYIKQEGSRLIQEIVRHFSAREEIEIPSYIYEKVILDIDWILEKGYAEKLDRTDFFHFHILIPDYRLSDYPDLDNREMIKDSQIKILYHTRESTGNVNPERNIISTLRSQPQLIHPFSFTMTHNGDLISKPYQNTWNTIYPEDLGCRDITGASFKVDSEGKYKLKDGRRIKFAYP